MAAERDDPAAGFFAALLGDGRPLLFAVAGSLLFSGGFCLFLAATREFLPHDIHYLGMSAADLCQVASCRVVDFMVHDRAAFGGALIGIGVLYLWLTAFPLAAGQPWAWWVWLVSGTLGFASFLGYLGYGYLDSWHGAGTALLLPIYVTGMVRARRLVAGPLTPRSLRRHGGWFGGTDRFSAGRLLLLLGAAGTAAGGLGILRVGLGETFVPEDLGFMGVTADQLRAFNPHLVPLIAHDRVGFAGAVITLGVTTFLCLWCAPLSRHVHQAVAVAGIGSLTGALGVHFWVGYTDGWHLLPAGVAALSLVAGLVVGYPGTDRRSLEVAAAGR